MHIKNLKVDYDLQPVKKFMVKSIRRKDTLTFHDYSKYTHIQAKRYLLRQNNDF